MKKKIIYLLEKGDFISGETIGRYLGVSRTAIWKHISSLKNQGYTIETVKNKGYKMISKPDKPFPEILNSGLDTEIIGKNIIYIDSVNSTNKYAKDLIKTNPIEGTIIIANKQCSGKGRKNRKWFSPIGGLWFSVVLYPKLSPQNGMLVTMASSVSVVEGIKDVTGISSVIKWPNDILINGMKVCGILTEFDAEIDLINYVIVGIGLNVNNKLNNELANTAVSLKSLLKQDISIVDLLRAIIKNLDKNYHHIKNKSYQTIRDSWFSYTDILNRKIRIIEDKKIIEGIVYNIDDNGCLVIKNKDGLKKK